MFINRWIENLTSFERLYHLAYGREVIKELVTDYVSAKLDGNKVVRVLDLGCGHGYDLENIKSSLSGYNVELFGADRYGPYINSLKEKGIKLFNFDIETDTYPFDDGFFDIVVINQVLEHCKEIFWILSEVSRILKKGGFLIVGVPNLAATNSRLKLLLGLQPGTINILSGHIRGFTIPGFKNFVETDGFFQVLSVRGEYFYPSVNESSARFFARYFPGLCVANFYLIRRTGTDGRFIKVLNNQFMETPYRGSQYYRTDLA